MEFKFNRHEIHEKQHKGDKKENNTNIKTKNKLLNDTNKNRKNKSMEINHLQYFVMLP